MIACPVLIARLAAALSLDISSKVLAQQQWSVNENRPQVPNKWKMVQVWKSSKDSYSLLICTLGQSQRWTTLKTFPFTLSAQAGSRPNNADQCSNTTIFIKESCCCSWWLGNFNYMLCCLEQICQKKRKSITGISLLTMGGNYRINYGTVKCI